MKLHKKLSSKNTNMFVITMIIFSVCLLMSLLWQNTIIHVNITEQCALLLIMKYLGNLSYAGTLVRITPRLLYVSLYSCIPLEDKAKCYAGRGPKLFLYNTFISVSCFCTQSLHSGFAIMRGDAGGKFGYSVQFVVWIQRSVSLAMQSIMTSK